LTGKEDGMGYRSDVAAVFYVTDKQKLPEIKLWLTENFPVEEFDSCVRWFTNGMVFECDDVKWYDTYPDVEAFNTAVEKFVDMFCKGDKEKFEGAYEFIRIGEEYEDVEVIREGDYDYLLEFNRSIGTTV